MLSFDPASPQHRHVLFVFRVGLEGRGNFESSKLEEHDFSEQLRHDVCWKDAPVASRVRHVLELRQNGDDVRKQCVGFGALLSNDLQKFFQDSQAQGFDRIRVDEGVTICTKQTQLRYKTSLKTDQQSVASL